MGVEVNEEILDKVAQTAMTGKSAEPDKEHLAEICVEVAMAAPLEDINIVARPNGKMRSRLLSAGLLIDGAKGSHEMPDAVETQRLVSLLQTLTSQTTRSNSMCKSEDNSGYKTSSLAETHNSLRSVSRNFKETGMNVLFCSRDIHPAIIEDLASKDSTLVRRVRRSDMEALANATKRESSNVDTISEKDLGNLSYLKRVNIGERPMIKITGTPNESTVSVLVQSTYATCG